MKKDIKDYLHLYLNSVDVIIDSVSEQFKSHFGHSPGHKTQLGPMLYAVILEDGCTVKLILRPLSSMTEADGLKIFGSKTKYLLYRKEAKDLGADLWLFTANEYTELLKSGFDCHDLIPNNLAINAETLK